MTTYSIFWDLDGALLGSIDAETPHDALVRFSYGYQPAEGERGHGLPGHGIVHFTHAEPTT